MSAAEKEREQLKSGLIVDRKDIDNFHRNNVVESGDSIDPAIDEFGFDDEDIALAIALSLSEGSTVGGDDGDDGGAIPSSPKGHTSITLYESPVLNTVENVISLFFRSNDSNSTPHGGKSASDPVDPQERDVQAQHQTLPLPLLHLVGPCKGQDLSTSIFEAMLPKSEVRLFISSTFDDTKFEQDVLLRKTFPNLKAFCNNLGLGFNVVSMRWGVLGRSGNKHMTSELCMTQLQKCLDESAGPAFVTLQSHRYGFCPFPSVIEQREFEAIKAALVAAHGGVTVDRRFENPYWRLDESCDPRVYQLQPVSTLPGCQDYLLSDEDKLRASKDDVFKREREEKRKAAGSVWWGDFEAMQSLLKEGAALANLPDEAQAKYRISVTHDEVMRGIIHNPRASTQSFCFMRNIDGILQASDDSKRTAKEYNDALEAQLNPLKAAIDAALDDSHVFRFAVPWVGEGKLHRSNALAPDEWRDYIETDFCEAFERAMKDQIMLSYRKPFENALLREMVAQNKLLTNKLKSYGFARTELIDALVSEDGYGGRATVLHGLSGAGKSWLMCKAVEALRASMPPRGVVVYRLLGTTRGSADALSVIRSVLLQVKLVYGLDNDNTAFSAFESMDWEAASEYCCQGSNAFAGACREAPLAIVLDSIDQLTNNNCALDDLGAWLPGFEHQLPPFVKVIISTLPVEKGRHLLSSMRRIGEDIGVKFVEAAALGLTTDGERAIDAMVRSRLAHGTILPLKCSLASRHQRAVLDLCAVQATPLFLTLMLDIACKWPSYACAADTLHMLQSRLLQGEREGVSGVRVLINHLFDELEGTHGKLLVSRMLGLLTLAREGLSEAELEDLLSMPDNDDVLNDVFEWWTPPIRRLPPMLVLRVMSDLGTYVVHRGTEGCLNWYHRQFREAAEARYCGGHVREVLHDTLANYFGNLVPEEVLQARHIASQPLTLNCDALDVWFPRAKVNTRRCIEAAHHMLASGKVRMAKLAESELCSLQGVCARAKSGMGVGGVVDGRR